MSGASCRTGHALGVAAACVIALAATPVLATPVTHSGWFKPRAGGNSYMLVDQHAGDAHGAIKYGRYGYENPLNGPYRNPFARN